MGSGAGALRVSTGRGGARWVRLGLSVSCAVGFASSVQGQASGVTHADYARAERLLGWNARQLVYHVPEEPQWIEESDRFWYRKRVPGGHAFVYVDPAAGLQRPAFDHARLAAALSEASGEALEPYRLPFEEIDLRDGANALQVWLKPSSEAPEEERGEEETDEVGEAGERSEEGDEEHRRFLCDLRSYVCRGPEDVPPPAEDEVESPDGRWVAFSRDENLWVRAVESGEEIQLSKDGAEHHGYGVPAEGCCYEVTARRAGTERQPVLVWSPDSSRIATYRLDERRVEPLWLLETQEGRPVLHTYRYPLVGDEVVPTFTLHLFDVPSGQKLEIRSEPAELFWGDRRPDFRWSEDGERLYWVHHHRGHQRAVLKVADAKSGESRALIEETSRSFLDLPMRDDVEDWRALDGGRRILWHSERDGWGHFYLFDASSGELQRQVTKGAWFAHQIHHVEETPGGGGWLYFEGLGREPDLYPYAAQLYRASLDGDRIERLTGEEAHHELHFSPSGAFVVDTFSLRDQPPVTVLRRSDGRILQRLEEADTGELQEVGWRPPHSFSVKARDGETRLYGFLYLPPDLEERESFPLVDYIYPGPQTGPIRHRGFTVEPSGSVQALAELGFFVLQLDATGTPWRSKAFHDRWYGDMGDNGILDHIHAIKQLAQRYPQIDLERIGIYGHSGGGFSSTGAILRFPDFFKVAVSGAGNHDNRSYSYAWGEKYQGPLEAGEDGSDSYASQANHLLAENLKGRLLLTYGTLDDNVHPNATLLLIDELIRHNKDFDLLVLPNRNHRYANEPYVVRRTWDYFVRHLLGEEPPSGYRIEAPPD